MQREVQEAQRLLSAGEPGRAEQLLRTLLCEAPDDVEAQYALAVAQRHQHRWDAALATLSAVIDRRPEFGRAHQECGYNHVARRDFANAQTAFERATGCDPALVNSWKCLARLYRDRGDEERLAAVRKHLAFLDNLPAELLPVISYLSEDKLREAEALCKKFLRANRTHVEGMRLLAEIATRNKIYEDAEFLLESCVEFEPENLEAGIQYANLLLKVQKFGKALEIVEQLLDRFNQEEDRIRALHAAACSGAGRNEAAAVGYRTLMRQQPRNPFHPLSLGHVYKSDGEVDRAVELYRQAYTIKQDYGDAYWSLANTKSYRFTDDEISQMTEMQAHTGTGELDRVQLCFALGKAHEDRDEFERAFACYARGNALKQATAHHSPHHLQIRVDSQIEVCTPELFAARADIGLPAPDPIFIVGLPRAGSTLLEQILASHSRVDGTMELHNVLNLAKRLRGRGDDEEAGPRYPKILGEIDHSYFRRFGQQFIDDTWAYRGTAPHFIDKMPNNFFHIGLIKLILPNARVIDARRHPMACCFSGFKQLFGEGQEFSYGLREIGNYYRQYVKLMDHWDRVLPGFVLCVSYEDVVEDLESQVRRLLDFCELPFEPACLEFHRTRRSVRTPSAAQVRQPIYTSGVAQWRHFEPWLDPLKEALGPEVLARYPLDA